MLRNKRVLITGGAGFIGANLARRLIGEKSIIHLLIKNRSNLWRLQDVKNKINFHFSDLQDYKAIKKLMDKIKPQFIFHLAAHGGYPNQTDLSTMVQTNVVGTANLLLAANTINYQALVNTGSSSEYGFKKETMKETDLLEPISYYAATKAGSTLLCQAFAKKNGKPIVTLRPFSVYGPWEEQSRFIATAIKAFLRKKTLNLTPGDQRRDFIFVDDMIDSYLLAARKAKIFKGEIFNIGSGKQHTNDEIVDIIGKATGMSIRVNKGAFPKRSWDTDNWVADNSKAKKILGWEAKYSLEQGLNKTLAWFRKNLAYY